MAHVSTGHGIAAGGPTVFPYAVSAICLRSVLPSIREPSTRLCVARAYRATRRRGAIGLVRQGRRRPGRRWARRGEGAQGPRAPSARTVPAPRPSSVTPTAGCPSLSLSLSSSPSLSRLHVQEHAPPQQLNTHPPGPVALDSDPSRPGAFTSFKLGAASGRARGERRAASRVDPPCLCHRPSATAPPPPVSAAGERGGGEKRRRRRRRRRRRKEGRKNNKRQGRGGSKLRGRGGGGRAPWPGPRRRPCARGSPTRSGGRRAPRRSARPRP
eukprot:2049907-Rhodomonas_salina.2